MKEFMTKKSKNKEDNKLEIPKALLSKTPNKEDIKSEIPKNLKGEKSIIEKFAPISENIKLLDDKNVDPNQEKHIEKEFVDDIELTQYIETAIKGRMKTIAKSKAKQMDSVFHSLDNIMPEFFDCCMVFGFNCLGERCVYLLAKNEKDKEAVFHHVKSVVYSSMGNGPE